MIQKFTYLIFFFTFFSAEARHEIYCNEGQCLTQGWTIIDTRTQLQTQVSCLQEDCSANGWQEMREGQVLTKTHCIENNCFTNGWEIFSGASKEKSMSVECLSDKNGEKNCLKSGWVVSGKSQRPVFEVRCLGQNCRQQGWEMENNDSGALQLSLCRESSCFENGWTLSP